MTAPTDTPVAAKPKWQIAMRIIISVICVIAAILGVLAFKVGAFFNLMIVGLLVGTLVVMAARLPYVIKGEMDWPFWTAPFSPARRGRWMQILPRAAFWFACAMIAHIGIVRAQFSPEDLRIIRLTYWGAAALLILISLMPKKVGAKPMTIFSLLALLPLSFVLIDSLNPQLSGQGAVEMHSPFASESVMFHAGHNTTVNYHVAHPSQQHAIDSVLTHANGRSHDGEMSDLNSYACFGAPLIAPIAGEVVSVESDHPDQAIGQMDAENPAGNHVVIKIDETHYTMLAHMQQGSAVVSAGDVVEIGDPLGACGNSGNTSEPHLHMQVQRFADLFAEDGFTYPIKFNGTTRRRGRATVSEDGLFYRRNDIMVPRSD